MDAVDHIYRHLARTPDTGLFYRKGASLQLEGFVDSDWAGDKDCSISTTGYCFRLAGGIVSWRSQRQKTVATSSTHAEYVAASEAAKEAFWIIGLLNELSFLDPLLSQGTMPLYIDNSLALKLTKNPESYARTRHIDVRYHYVRELVESKVIDTRWISGKTNPADMFTKPLPIVTLQAIKDNVSVGPPYSTVAAQARTASVAAVRQGESSH